MGPYTFWTMCRLINAYIGVLSACRESVVKCLAKENGLGVNWRPPLPSNPGCLFCEGEALYRVAASVLAGFGFSQHFDDHVLGS